MLLSRFLYPSCFCLQFDSLQLRVLGLYRDAGILGAEGGAGGGNIQGQAPYAGLTGRVLRALELSRPWAVSRFQSVVAIFAIRLVGVLRSSAMFLEGNVREVAVFRGVRIVLFKDFLLLYFRVSSIALHRDVITLRIVVLRRLLPASVRLVARLFRDVSIANGRVDGIVNCVRQVQIRRPQVFARLAFQVGAFKVMLVRVVVLCGDGRAINVKEVYNVPYLFRATYPSFVVNGVRLRRGDVTYPADRGHEVVLVEIS